MLNKELLMVGSESLEPVLSIYISPDISYFPTVSCMLTTGILSYVSNAGETTFKFSELQLIERISVSYTEGTQLSTTNLQSMGASYRGGAPLAPPAMWAEFRIRDRTQSVSISLT